MPVCEDGNLDLNACGNVQEEPLAIDKRTDILPTMELEETDNFRATGRLKPSELPRPLHKVVIIILMFIGNKWRETKINNINYFFSMKSMKHEFG